ncbi:hypothetical protein [uncultured Methanobrevibacter sp.]|uniref:hypothetical protein n=1 Tax=uncultured Methanobrevibacter sp. TaxID=253161 RepID=UPI00262AAE17|nr:hypothetical protein [uncultured Methanobrevibacter sp.]
MLEEFVPFIGLLIFGNIENLVLSSQGVVAGANILKLSILSIICVIIWLIVGTVGATVASQYADFIDFIGGLAIFILGLQAMYESIVNK